MPEAALALDRGRARLGGACDALRAVAADLEQDLEPFDEARRAIDEFGVRVVVVGEVNRGKSTFLNALLGCRVFPSRAVFFTAVLTELVDGPPSATVLFRSGERESLELDGEDPSKALHTVVSRKNPRAAEIERAQVAFPNRFARDGVVLIDTPGVNDPVAWREEITRAAVAEADAAIFLLDPQTPLRQSERLFLQEGV